ncbi:MAG: response regulator [Chromatiales bacterium]|nr:response regulator [Chromatiales bacterium]
MLDDIRFARESFKFASPRSQFHLLSMMLFIAAVNGLFRPAADASVLDAWSIIYTLMLIAGTAATRLDKDRMLANYSLRQLRALISTLVAAGTFCWCLLAFVLRPDAREVQIAGLIAIMTIGVALGAFLIAAYFKHCVASISVPFAALAWQVWHLDQASAPALTATVAVIWATLLVFARMIHDVQIEAIHLSLRNQDMIERLSEETDKASRANASKTRFLAAASHDMRQPLQASAFFLESLKATDPSPPQRALIERIDDAIGGLSEHLGGMLDIAKLEMQSMPVQVSHFPLGELLARLDRQFTDAFAAKGLRLQVAPVDAVLHTDPLLFERMLLNLLTNALRYTDAGEVQVATRVTGDHVLISVSDTGHGIPEDARETVFEAFVQLHNSERDRRKGLGLGLSIVKQISELLAIPIELDSEPGVGSRFTLRVPLGDAAELPDTAPSPTRLLDLAGTRVLLVDDEEAVREALGGVLRGWGCTIDTADGPAALADIVQPDLLITDFRLRDERTGLDVIAALEARFGPLPTLIVTGETAPERIAAAEAAGRIVLHKPVSPLQLRAAIHQALIAD